MKQRQASDVRSPQHHEQGSDAMLARHSSSRQLPVLSHISASTGPVISPVNGTLIIHVKADAYNSIISISDVTTINDISNGSNNTSTPSYEQLSREFYQSYDPSIGLHTAAVLGGILIWLVLYVIYRTKIRKCIIRLIKKTFGETDELDTKVSDSQQDSNNLTMIQNLANPSIVIEASPHQNQPESPVAYDQCYQDGQDCLSPYSLPGAGSEILQFLYPHHGGSNQDLCQCQCCPDHQEILLQLPKSEADIPSATAQWVQNMPLAARSQQDFAGLMLSMQSHGLLAMHKPCSCPLVCPRTPQPLPLLELPNTWNNSLPVLSNSLSSQILSAYETVNNQLRNNEINDIITAKRKLRHNNKRHDKFDKDNSEHTFLIEKNQFDNYDYHRRHSHSVFKYHNDYSRKKKHGNKSPKDVIKSSHDKENAHFLHNSSLTRSPLPVPVTPTVTIHNSKPVHNYRGGCHSYTSISSSSSTDILLAPPQPPYIHISKPSSSSIPSPHLLSPSCNSRSGGHHFRWSSRDINSYHDDRNASRSRSVSPHSHKRHHQCSFKYHTRDSTKDSKLHPLNDCRLSRHGSSYDNNLAAMTNSCHVQRNLGNHSRSLNYFNYNSSLQLNSRFPIQQNQRSQSADVSLSLNLQRNPGSPTFSNGSNKYSIGTSSRSHTPSPHFLQVPDPNNLFRPVTPDFAVSKHYIDVPNGGGQSSMRHCVHSDSNIAYNAGQYFPAVTHVDNSSIRRHSTFTSGPGEINLLFFGDNSVRPSSSLGSSGMYNSSYFLSHHNQHCNQRSHQQHHRSTGLLTLDNYNNQRDVLFSHTGLNRSYSAVMMETKL